MSKPDADVRLSGTDVADLRLPAQSAVGRNSTGRRQYAPTTGKGWRGKKGGSFVQLSFALLDEVCETRAMVLVAAEIQWRHWSHKGQPFELGNRNLKSWGVDRKTKAAVLKKLKQRG
jgi:hypothetical protein